MQHPGEDRGEVRSLSLSLRCELMVDLQAAPMTPAVMPIVIAPAQSVLDDMSDAEEEQDGVGSGSQDSRVLRTRTVVISERVQEKQREREVGRSSKKVLRLMVRTALLSSPRVLIRY